MTDHYITYQSTNAPKSEEWCAYLTKFKVFCFGATEADACDKAKAFYDKQRASITVYNDQGEPEIKNLGSSHGNAGKVWMRHPQHGLGRFPMTEIVMREGMGYVRSGPRGKV